jgi:hypothetical protein
MMQFLNETFPQTMDWTLLANSMATQVSGSDSSGFLLQCFDRQGLHTTYAIDSVGSFKIESDMPML